MKTEKMARLQVKIGGFKSCVTNQLQGKGRGSGSLGLEQCYFI